MGKILLFYFLGVYEFILEGNFSLFQTLEHSRQFVFRVEPSGKFYQELSDSNRKYICF